MIFSTIPRLILRSYQSPFQEALALSMLHCEIRQKTCVGQFTAVWPYSSITFLILSCEPTSSPSRVKKAETNGLIKRVHQINLL